MMSKKPVVRTTIDEAINQQAMTVLAAMSFTMSDAVRILLLCITMEKQLKLVPLIPNAEPLAAMQEAETGKLEKFDSGEELFENLNAYE